MTSAAQNPALDFRAFEQAINAQRERLFHVSVVLSCLGSALDDVGAPGVGAPDLQKVTDATIWILDRVAAKLDPAMLRREHLAVDSTAALIVAEGLRDAAVQCRSDQVALRARLVQAACVIEQLVGDS